MITLICVLSLLLVTTVQCFFTPVLEIPQGQLVGSLSQRNKYMSFLGIPYASFTERFKEAGPPPKFKSTFFALHGGTVCAQLSRNGIVMGGENCLFLNVFTPLNYTEEKKLLPTMVFIHGGGYFTGSNSKLIYNPKYLVKKGVVVVTIKYRLGAFGFLCLGIKDAPGNMGLKDQIAALRWVQKNIEYFGGNPNLVTVFGESAGSASVNNLLLSPLAKGLFHQAILESGSALSAFGFVSNPIEKASLVAEKLVNRSTTDPLELLEIYKNARVSQLLKASVTGQTNLVPNIFNFAPCAENTMLDNKPFLTEAPLKLMQAGKFLKVPMIIGYNDQEGIYYASRYVNNDKMLKSLRQNFSVSLPYFLDIKNKSDKENVAKEVRKFYFDDNNIGSETAQNLIEYFSDVVFWFPSVINIKYLLEQSVQVYNYFFKYDTNRNLAKFVYGGTLKDVDGASHGDELFYLLDSIVLSGKFKNRRTHISVERMTTMWTNFAKYGKPTLEPTSILPVNWIPSNKSELNYLQINDNIKMISLPEKHRIDFWLNLFEKYNINK